MKKILLLLCIFAYQLNIAQNGYWTQVGMLKFPFNPSVQTTGLGRISDVAFHPSNNQIIFAVSSSGGLFKTENEAQTWKAISDTLVALNCASVAVKPDNGNYILLGTGDGNYNSTTKAKGVYKSTDGGKTWSLSNSGMGNKLVSKMYFHPTQTNLVWAACSDGIYKSSDAGLTWTLKTTVATSYRSLELKANPNTKTLYAATNTDFYYSNNLGESWTQLSHTGTGFDTQGGVAMSAIKIGVSPADTNVVYTVVWDPTHRYGGLFKSINSGLNWTLQSYATNPSTVTNPNILGYQADGVESTLNGQGAYNLAIAVDKVNINTIYVGAINIWKSTDAGVTWTCKSHWGFGVHADKHYLGYSPHYSSPYKMYCANDGGMYRTLDDWTNWSEISQGIAATEFTKLGQSPVYKEVLLSGTQDNGLNLERDLDFYTIKGGDWYGDFEFDPRNPNIAYYHGGKRRVTKSGGAETDILNPNGTRGYYLCHKIDSNFLFAYDTNLYRSSNIKTPVATNIVWSKLTNNLFNSNTALIVKAECSNIDPNLLIMLRNDKLVIKSNNILSATPTFTSYPTPAFATPNTNSCIDINRIDPTIIYLSIGSKIYRSINQGQTWSDFSGTLPAKTIFKIIHDKYSSDESVYACNSGAVYYRNNTMSDWISYSNGLPAIADLVDMELVDDGTPNGVLRTAFYGRGIFQSALRRNYTQSPTALFNYYSIPSSCNNLLIFNDQSVGQPITSRLWTITPSNAASFVNNSNNISQSPQLQFNPNIGNCTVSLVVTNSVGTSTYTKAFNFAQLPNNASCSPTYSSGTGSGDLINRVRIGSLDNTSSGSTSPFYTNYSCANSTSITPNQSYSLIINFGSDATQFCGAWIDYNNDNIFTTSEWLGGNTINAGANGSYAINFTVPANAVSGIVRLRIRGGDDVAVPSSGFCGTGVWGETEDYPIIIASSSTAICTNLSLPYNHQILTTLNTTLTWEVAVGATSYDIYLGTDANPTFFANTTSLSYAVSLFAATQYYWTVKPKFGTSSSTACEIRDFISGPFLYAPNCSNQISPANNAFISNSPILSWSSIPEATSYDVYLGTTNPPTTLIAFGTTQTTYSINNLQNGVRYYWYVTPKNSIGSATGCAASTFAFDVDATTTGNNYCIPIYASGGVNDVITRVRLSNIDNTSTGNILPYYSYFSNVDAAILNLNSNNNLIINFGSDANQFCAAWIDYNKDGVFDSSTEFIGNNIVDAGANGIYTINFTVPANALPGITRLRIRGGDDAALNSTQACGVSSNNFGQTEDYNVNILADNSISFNTTVSPVLCANSIININYTVTGTFNAGNDFILQLSDATGAFTSPTNIGTINSITSGTISGTIPNVNGSFFKMRIVSTNPIKNSNSSTQNVSIKSSGNWLGITNDWNNANNWCGGLIPTNTTDVFISQNTANMPTLNANAFCNNLHLENNSTIQLNGFELTMQGQIQGGGNFTGSPLSSLTINGTGNFGTLNFSQTNSNSLALRKLTINRSSSGTVYIAKPLHIYGEVILNNGTLFTGDLLTLKSDATNSARIAPVNALALIKGNVTVERFIPGGLTGWSMIASPVESAQILDWQDDFPTSGFTGATGWAGIFNSVYDYSENTLGAQSNGFNAATNATNLLVPGKGRWVYLGNGFTNTTDITIDVKGPVKVGNISLPVTYTNTTPTALPNEDGWNLMANPYPSSIDWNSSFITKTNINDAIYIYNTDNQNFATYAAGVGVNGGSQYIAASQAFWVKANASNPSLTLTENAKSNQNPTFLKTVGNATSSNNDVIKIQLACSSGTDEIAVVFNQSSTMNSDDLGDAPKLANTSTNNASIFTLSNGTAMAINSQSPLNSSTIPLEIINPSMGIFHLSFNVSSSSFNAVYLWDSKQNITYDLLQNNNYVLSWFDTSASSNDRYFLIFDNMTSILNNHNSNILNIYPNPTTFELMVVGEETGTIEIFDIAGKTIIEQTITQSKNKINLASISAGIYTAQFTNGIQSKFVRFIKQ